MGKSKKNNKKKHNGSKQKNTNQNRAKDTNIVKNVSAPKEHETVKEDVKVKKSTVNKKNDKNVGAATKMRLDEIDIIKAIGIICMVAVHASIPGKENISLFHMAVFFIASGFFFRSKSSDDLKSVGKFTIKRWKQLWIPYFIWNAIFTLCNNLFMKCNVYTDNMGIAQYVPENFYEMHPYMGLTAMAKNIAKGVVFLGGTQIGGAFWFLKVLFVVSVGFCVMDFIAKKILHKHAVLLQAFVASILLGAGYYCSLRGLHFYGAEQVATCYWMYLMGYLLAEIKETYLNRKWWQYLVAMVLSLGVLIYLSQFGTISLAKNTFHNPCFLIVASLAGWVFLYSISYFLKKIGVLKDVLCLIGKTTLPVMILHFLCMKIVAYAVTRFYFIPAYCVAAFPNLYGNTDAWWLAYTAVGVSVPIFLDLIYQKCKKKLFPAKVA